jgi:DNA-binding transcriptional LysR family regulator
MLVHDALENGRLVRVLPPCEDRPSSKAHIVRWPSTLRNDERVKAFTSWLVKKARETVTG